jgi:hypothetical protein
VGTAIGERSSPKPGKPANFCALSGTGLRPRLCAVKPQPPEQLTTGSAPPLSVKKYALLVPAE